MFKKYSQVSTLSEPIVGFSDEYPSGYLDANHSHQHSQLLFAVSGVMQVITDLASFTVPPHRALLLPALIMHEVRCRGAVSFRTLFFDQTVELPDACMLIDVSDFLRALILEIVSRSDDRIFGSREKRISQILLDELQAMPAAPYSVRMPADKRLRRVCRALLFNPADQRPLDNWASAAAMGRRSFTRLFREQTGTSFEIWKRDIRLMEAISLLTSGCTVTETAFEVGYDNVSAFTAMFRRTFGLPPTRFIKHRGRKDKLVLRR